MSIQRARWIALIISVLPVALSPVAQASTVTQVLYPLAQPNDPIALDDLLRQDGLGYTCIEEAQIDVAFFASGKGARLPQTCLPEPCDAALTQAGLGGLIGRAPTVGEWDDYYARYSDTCRAETTAFGSAPGADQPQSTQDFWTPILVGATPTFDALVENWLDNTTANTVMGLGTERSRNRNNPIASFGSSGSSGFSSGGTGSAGSVATETAAAEQFDVASDSSTNNSGGDGSQEDGASDVSNSGGSGGGSNDSGGDGSNGGGGGGSNGGGGDGSNGGGGEGSNGGGGDGSNGGGGDGSNGGGGDGSNGGGGDGSNGGGGDGSNGGGGGGSGFFDDDNDAGMNDDSSWTDDGNVPAVPLPIGMWFALSGIAALGGLKLQQRRRQT